MTVTTSRPVTAGFRLAAALAAGLTLATAGAARADDVAARELFAARPLPAAMKPQPIGFYSRGCLAGGIAIPVDGPDWQVMRLSRNRRWGHPDLIRLIEDLSVKAKADGWNGLMVGDISQPRGGPMLTGHASHQIGLDVDLWFMPMPGRRLSYAEREETSAISVLKAGSFLVDDARWTRAHERLLYHAAAYPRVERILVHPGVKKKLCETVKGDRAWLGKIRPYYGHHYHFHLRITCPQDAANCRPQDPVPAGEGCEQAVFDWWFKDALVPKKPAKPDTPTRPRHLRLADLPPPCAGVLEAEAVAPEAAELALKNASFSAPAIDMPTFDAAAIRASRPIEASRSAAEADERAAAATPLADVPVPTPRPTD